MKGDQVTEKTEKTAQERLATEVVDLWESDSLVWASDGPAVAAQEKFQKAVEQAARVFLIELREATEDNVSPESRLGTVGEHSPEYVALIAERDPYETPFGRRRFPKRQSRYFLYGLEAAEDAAEDAARDALGWALDAYKRDTIAAAEAGEIKPGADHPNRCEPCDEWPERREDGRFVCPDCGAEVE